MSETTKKKRAPSGTRMRALCELLDKAGPLNLQQVRERMTGLTDSHVRHLLSTSRKKGLIVLRNCRKRGLIGAPGVDLGFCYVVEPDWRKQLGVQRASSVRTLTQWRPYPWGAAA